MKPDGAKLEGFGAPGFRQRVSQVSLQRSRHPGGLVFVFPQLGRRQTQEQNSGTRQTMISKASEALKDKARIKARARKPPYLIPATSTSSPSLELNSSSCRAVGAGLGSVGLFIPRATAVGPGQGVP